MMAATGAPDAGGESGREVAMDAATAGLIAAMYRACVDEGMGFEGDWTAQKPIVVEAFRISGASRHEMWDMNLISGEEHDMATCEDAYCSGARAIEAERAGATRGDL